MVLKYSCSVAYITYICVHSNHSPHTLCPRLYAAILAWSAANVKITFLLVWLWQCISSCVEYLLEIFYFGRQDKIKVKSKPFISLLTPVAHLTAYEQILYSRAYTTPSTLTYIIYTCRSLPCSTRKVFHGCFYRVPRQNLVEDWNPSSPLQQQQRLWGTLRTTASWNFKWWKLLGRYLPANIHTPLCNICSLSLLKLLFSLKSWWRLTVLLTFVST